jgi:surfeit locus 1 family protein
VSQTRRFPIGLTISVAIALAILCGLGVWQLQRKAWKEALLARVAALEHAAPIPLADALQRARKGEDVDLVRVEAECPALTHAPFVEQYALVGGEAGARIISACAVEVAGWSGVLVDRGFVINTVSARPPVEKADPTPVRVVGVLRKPEPPTFVTPQRTGQGAFYWRDIAGMAAALKQPAPAPYMLTAETSTNPEWKALQPLATPKEISNRHLEYALTWFGLGAALVGVYIAMLARRRKGATA